MLLYDDMIFSLVQKWRLLLSTIRVKELIGNPVLVWKKKEQQLHFRFNLAITLGSSPVWIELSLFQGRAREKDYFDEWERRITSTGPATHSTWTSMLHNTDPISTWKSRHHNSCGLRTLLQSYFYLLYGWYGRVEMVWHQSLDVVWWNPADE